VDSTVVVAALERPTAAQVAQIADLFDQYRAHYGEAPDRERSSAWLQRNISAGVLSVFTADANGEMVGLALTMTVPASVRLGHYWLIKDLFVVPQWRRVGIARALLSHIHSTAVSAEALRLVVQTEADNSNALRLYEGSGFVPIEGYRSLVRPLDPAS
jgi:GNAT superfamily N-acetyltransferase